MHFRSLLLLRVPPGTREHAVQTYLARRCIEECAETVSGFIDAEVMLSADDPDLVCVTSRWRDAAAHQQWLESPVRLAQSRDLSALLDSAAPEAARAMGFRCVRAWEPQPR